MMNTYDGERFQTAAVVLAYARGVGMRVVYDIEMSGLPHWRRSSFPHRCAARLARRQSCARWRATALPSRRVRRSRLSRWSAGLWLESDRYEPPRRDRT